MHRRHALVTAVALAIYGAEEPAAPIAEKLNREVRRSLQLPKSRAYFAQQALMSEDLDLAGTTAFVGNEVAHWSALAKSIAMIAQ